ncbi:hypothetical protein QTP88_024064 [Uroleucon formosanum]
MTSVANDIDEILRELIDTIINNSIIDVPEDPKIQGDVEDIDDIVKVLMDEIIEAVFDVNPELMAGDDVEVTEITEAVKVEETTAENKQQERVRDELTRNNEAETPKTANHKAPGGRSRRIMVTTWKRVRRVTRLLLCECFRGE